MSKTSTNKRKNTNRKVRRNTNRKVRKNTKRKVRKTRRINKSGKIYRGGAIEFTEFITGIFGEYFEIPNLVDYISSFNNEWLYKKIHKLYLLNCKLLSLKSDETKYRDFKSKIQSALGDPNIVNNTDPVSLAKVISVIITFNGSISNESDILKMMNDCSDSYCFENQTFTVPESTSPSQFADHCKFNDFKDSLIGNYFIETGIKLFKVKTDVLYRLAYLLTSLNNQNDECTRGPTSFNVDTLFPNQSVQGVDAEEVVTSSDTTPTAEEIQTPTAEEIQTNNEYLVIFDNITQIQDMFNELKQLNHLNESEQTIIHEKLDSISTKLFELFNVNIRNLGFLELGESGMEMVGGLDVFIHMFKYNENLTGFHDRWITAFSESKKDPSNETLKTAADDAKIFYMEQLKAREKMAPGYSALRKQERYSLILDKINETIISAIKMIEERLNLLLAADQGGGGERKLGWVGGGLGYALLLCLVLLILGVGLAFVDDERIRREEVAGLISKEQREMNALPLDKLQDKAIEIGVSEDAIHIASGAIDPKEAMIQTILAHLKQIYQDDNERMYAMDSWRADGIRLRRG